MSQSIDFYLTASGDDYRPPTPSPSLQQYDNYQIHDLYCDDIVYFAPVETPSLTLPDPIEFKNFLAVERVSLFGTIDCNFEAIALMHP